MEVYSVSTVGNPEFINVKSYNPLISRCEIKVLYLGENRNGSYIDKDAATKMANTLPGVPIVGVYRQEEDDFGGHGDVITIEDGEIKFSCSTVPYGFVDPNADVWFQDWEEDGTVRTYLMTEGFLWTGQYQEAQAALAGKGQSMELDPEHLDGKWADVNSSGMEFFIINDAIFSKLCILGDDVEPCFEGASIQEKFSNADVVYTLHHMAEQLKFALENSEGGLNMPNEEMTPTDVAEEVQEEPTEFTEEQATVDEVEEVEPTEEFSAEEGDEMTEDLASVEDDAAEFSVTESTPATEESDPSSINENTSFSAELESMQKELAELREFKLNVERKQKMEIVNRYHMLSDAEKQPIVDELDNYSMLEIEKELAYIYVKNNVDFNTVDGQPEEKVEQDVSEELTTFSLDGLDNGEAVEDDLIEALRSSTVSF